MATKTFPMVRGRKIRITKLDGCGNPVPGECSQVVTEGFISVGLTSNIQEPEEITVTNANGTTCVRDAGCASFQDYSVEVQFCDVDPSVFQLMTGQLPWTTEDDASGNRVGDVVGFTMNSDITACDSAFALEMWTGVPGVACSGNSGEGSFGYILLPFVSNGVIGDFTVENAATNFTVTGAATKGGNAWGVGLNDVVLDSGGKPAKLPRPLDENDHMLVSWTQLAPPSVDGCVGVAGGAVQALAKSRTDWAKGHAAPGDVFAAVTAISASDATNAAKLSTNGFTPTVKTAWTSGQKIEVGGFAFSWDGTKWAAGAVV